MLQRNFIPIGLLEITEKRMTFSTDLLNEWREEEKLLYEKYYWLKIMLKQKIQNYKSCAKKLGLSERVEDVKLNQIIDDFVLIQMKEYNKRCKWIWLFNEEYGGEG